MARNSEESFQEILKRLAKNTKDYEDKSIKHYQWADRVDSIFLDYNATWTKAEFYAELNKRLGVKVNVSKHKTNHKKEAKF